MIRSLFSIALACICLTQREARAEPSVVYGEGTFIARKRVNENVFFFGEVRHLEGLGTEQFEEMLTSAVLGFGGNFANGIRVETGFGLVARLERGRHAEELAGTTVSWLEEERMNGWSESFRVFMEHGRIATAGEVLIGMPFSSNENRKPFIEGRYSLAVLVAGKKDEGRRFWFGIHVDQLNTRLTDGLNLTFAFGKMNVVSLRLSLNSGLTDNAPEWSSRLGLVCDFE
ncbi:MAG: hypothetical protein WC866_04830 [Patescibacteria group bacterium]|jgi:hypothetical protein